MNKKLITLSILTVLTVCGYASADMTAVGPATVSGSWTQDFNIRDRAWFVIWFDSDFDAVSINMQEGALELPGMTNLNPAMTLGVNGPTDVWASGHNVANLDFTLNFEGSIGDSVKFKTVVYDYKNREYRAVGWVTSSWDGSDWDIVNDSARLTTYGGAVDLDVIPVPGAFLLGMLGLSAAGIKLRKHA